MSQENFTLHVKLQEVAGQCADKIAVRSRRGDEIKSFTYAEFYAEAQKVAAALVAFGIKCDDKVAILLENRLEWGCIYFGILLSGAIAVPLDAQASIADLEFFCVDSGCKALFTSLIFSDKVKKARKNAVQLERIIVLDVAENGEDTFSYQKSIIDNVDVGQTFPARQIEDVASILYTSGTTGRYKGVMLTHKNFYANFLGITYTDFPLANQHVLALLPLHHSFPFMATLIAPLFSCGQVTYLNSLKSDDLLHCLQQDDITVIVGVPQLFLR